MALVLFLILLVTPLLCASQIFAAAQQEDSSTTTPPPITMLTTVRTSKQVLGAPVFFCCPPQLLSRKTTRCQQSDDFCVCVASTDGSVQVSKLGPYQAKWTQQLAAGVRSMPAFLSDEDVLRTPPSQVLVTMERGQAASLSLLDGKILWGETAKYSSRGKSFSPTYDKRSGVVFVPYQDHNLVALSVNGNGSGGADEVMQVENSDGVWSQPLVSGGNLVFARTASTSVSLVNISRVKRVRPSDVGNSFPKLKAKWTYTVMPTPNWKAAVGSWIWTSPVQVCTSSSNIDGSDETKSSCLIVFGCVDGRVRALSLNDGVLRWTSKKHVGGISQPVVQVTIDHFVFATDAGSIEIVNFAMILQNASNTDSGSNNIQRTLLTLSQQIHAPIHAVGVHTSVSSIEPAVVVTTQKGRVVVIKIDPSTTTSQQVPFVDYTFAVDCDVMSSSLAAGRFLGLGCRTGRAYALELSNAVFAPLAFGKEPAAAAAAGIVVTKAKGDSPATQFQDKPVNSNGSGVDSTTTTTTTSVSSSSTAGLYALVAALTFVTGLALSWTRIGSWSWWMNEQHPETKGV